jgi:hypothetical protein
VNYPFLFVVPQAIEYQENMTVYSVTMIFADILNWDLSNEKDCVSDMSMEAKRFLAYLKYGQNTSPTLYDNIDVNMPVQAIPFFERFGDHVAGVAMEVPLIVYDTLDSCDYYPTPTATAAPTSTPTPTPTPTPSPVVINQISLIGEFSNWTSDVYFSTVDNVNWTLSNWTQAVSGDAKIRANSDWLTYWASTSFPSGTAELNAPFNFYIPDGTYDVTFNSSTYQFSFTTTPTNTSTPTQTPTNTNTPSITPTNTPIPFCLDIVSLTNNFGPSDTDGNYDYIGNGYVNIDTSSSTYTLYYGIAPDSINYSLYQSGATNYVVATFIDNVLDILGPYNYWDGGAYLFGNIPSTISSGYVIPTNPSDDFTIEYPNCPLPTPTVTATNTSTPTVTPTNTTTPTPTETCPITTQYLEVQLSENTKFKLILWNNPDYTSPANALCDYTISGTAYGSLGTVYSGVETINSGQHQHQFNLAPILQPSEIVSAFDVLSYSATTCQCPVNLILP